jgi:hypothetical protein
MEMPTMSDARVIVANACENRDGLIWTRLEAIVPELFAAGPVAIKLCYYAAEDDHRIRPMMSTRWSTDPDDLAELIAHGRRNCFCGCYLNIANILAAAVEESKQGPIQAVVVIGDGFHDDRKTVAGYVEQLRARGASLFMFEQAIDRQETSASIAYRNLAEQTGGAYLRFIESVERVSERLPDLLRSVAHYTVGGTAALESLDNEAATLLLEQLSANQIPFDTSAVSLPDRLAVPRKRD